jgi:hypothetical protein
MAVQDHFSDVIVDLVKPVVSRVLVSLGMGYVTYEGFDILLDSIISGMRDTFLGVGSDILTILTMAGFDKLIGLYLGAITLKLSFKTLTKMVVFNVPS